MFVVLFACAKMSSNDVTFATWLLRLIMSHIIARMSLTRKCDDFKIFWFNLRRKRRQRNDDLISLKSRTRNCSIFSKQSVSKSRINFLKKQLTFRSNLQKSRNKRKLKWRMKLTSLRRLRMSMRRNRSWIVWWLRLFENNASNTRLKIKIKTKIKFIK